MLSLMRLSVRDQELVRIVDASLAEVTLRAGAFLVCRVGCTQCCHGAFAINALDAARLRSGMDEIRGANPALAAEIERRARNWCAAYGADFPGDRKTGALGSSVEEQERFAEFANEAACPALDPATGRCDVYAWRPLTCRVFGPPVRSKNDDGVEGLGHCELCFVGAASEEIAACEMPVPHALEADLLQDVDESFETVVAFALLP